ncbi:MAG: hypothetical protein O3A87_12375 [Verrucomicrobia bacterium]|nr:hypothetical protein [Verrucomicrobiota bacterium]MDA1007257.1 hypothetical protein [Verrucomicrobiota bacterium]
MRNRSTIAPTTPALPDFDHDKPTCKFQVRLSGLHGQNVNDLLA